MNTNRTISILAILLFAQLPFSQEISDPNEIQKDWVDQQVEELSDDTKSLDEKVLRLALTEYKDAIDREVTKSPILSVVDFSKKSGSPRLWVIDLFHSRVLFHELVAHGQNSGTHALATRFSNKHGSHQSSLGLFLTGKSYIGSKGYSLEVHGLNKGINDNALKRRVVMHGANYVSEERAKTLGHVGRSHGCFSVRRKIVTPLIDAIKSGSLLYAYHPQLLNMV